MLRSLRKCISNGRLRQVGRFLLTVGVFVFVGSAITFAQDSRRGQVFRDCPDCPEMVMVPPGSFQMGFEGGLEGRFEGSVRKVEISRAFALGRTEITNAQWRRFVAETGHPTGENCAVWNVNRWTLVEGVSWTNPNDGRPIRENEPVVCVSWHDAKAYVAWLSQLTGAPYRLPAEAEWEYAARAGKVGEFTWGNKAEDGCRVANIYDVSAQDPNRPFPVTSCNDRFTSIAPVASFEKNGFELYDMTGNVWEWMEDCYVMPAPSQPVDGKPQIRNGCDRRVTKGGAWSSPIFWQRPTFRGRDDPNLMSHIFGFRIARDLSPDGAGSRRTTRH